MPKTPTVSILCLTYNQADYVKEALDSFLKQETDFGIEILINDDASDDGTVGILKEYEKKHNDLIKVVYQKSNQYSAGKRNFFGRYLLPIARGKYVALCEGDDYWTDPYKLQKQVEFMEANPDHSLCFHPVRVVYEGGDKEDETFPERTTDFSVSSLLENNFIQTNSVMYRRQDYNSMAYDLSPADWYLHLYHAQFGRIGFINEPMAVYRKHAAGIWSGSDDKSVFWRRQAVGHLALYNAMISIYGGQPKYRKVIDGKIVDAVRGIQLLDQNESSKLLQEITKKHPDLAELIIAEMDRFLLVDRQDSARKVGLLNDSLKELRAELELIKSSRTWKIRNKLAKLLGKTKV